MKKEAAVPQVPHSVPTSDRMDVVNGSTPPACQSSEDRRGSDRAATVFTIGKLDADGAERPCMVRDISQGGMRIQMTTPPAIGTQVVVEMRGLDPRTATVRWVNGRDAGLAFDDDCDLTEIFDARVRKEGRIARQPRFAIEHSVELVVDKVAARAKVADISIGGARLIVADTSRLKAGALVALKLGLTFDTIAAEVAWVDEGACGLRFLKPISSIALALALEATGR